MNASMYRLSSVLCAIFALSVYTPVLAQSAPETEVASVSRLLERVNIPLESFTLENGLRVYVSTDHKAPVVAVGVWYKVGSKDEPAGKTGYAHLFEHLMFGGSENATGGFDTLLEAMGASGMNGSTDSDRTNYFQKVPTAALDQILYLESDRMGHLLGTLSQERLDNQRGVVQNEKRQGDSEPYGMVNYAISEALYPVGHPYRHTPIGSMSDLDRASIEDMRNWFRDHYGPNNAVLVLSGDIDLVTAKEKVHQYFADIPRGPDVRPIQPDVPTLDTPKSEVITDRVPSAAIGRAWTLPPADHPDIAPLVVGADILGGLSTARLTQTLVKDEQLASDVRVSASAGALGGRFQVSMIVKPGVDPGLAGQRLDEIITDYIQTGPTADEVERAARTAVTTTIKTGGVLMGRAIVIGEGAIWNDPERYRRELEQYVAATPATIVKAMQTWLSRPVFALTVLPGDRAPYEEATNATRHTPPPAPLTIQPRAPLPPLGEIAGLNLPAPTRARLSNGIEVQYLHRSDTPTTAIELSLDAGYGAESKDNRGIQNMMADLLQEGTLTLSNKALLERKALLGADISTDIDLDRTSISMNALSDNLAPSLALMADIVIQPRFDASDIERSRELILARIDQANTSAAAATRTLNPMIYGLAHPYGGPGGVGYSDTVKSITRDDLIAYHSAWVRPDKATLFVVSDQPLEQVIPALEERFGTWKATGIPGQKSFDLAAPAAEPRILLIDLKGAPQSMIIGGQQLPMNGTVDRLALEMASSILGDGMSSRITHDLRETKGWSYGGGGEIMKGVHALAFVVSAAVQADKTGPSIEALRQQVSEFLTTRGVTSEELTRNRNQEIRSLAGRFEGSFSVMSAMQNAQKFNRPDDYYNTLADRLRALSAAEIDQAARAVIKPDQFIWIVAGDAATIRPQLAEIGLPIEEIQLETKIASSVAAPDRE